MTGYSQRSSEQAQRMQLKYRRREFGVSDAIILVPVPDTRRCPVCGGSGIIDDFEHQAILSCLGQLTMHGWLLPGVCPACRGSN